MTASVGNPTDAAGNCMIGDRKVLVVFAVQKTASAGNPPEAVGNHIIVNRKVPVVFVVPKTNLKEYHNYHNIYYQKELNCYS